MGSIIIWCHFKYKQLYDLDLKTSSSLLKISLFPLKNRKTQKFCQIQMVKLSFVSITKFPTSWWNLRWSITRRGSERCRSCSTVCRGLCGDAQARGGVGAVLGEFEWAHGSGEVSHPFYIILWWFNLDLGVIQLFISLQLVITLWFYKQTLSWP